jgi:hypothetical protein
LLPEILSNFWVIQKPVNCRMMVVMYYGDGDGRCERRNASSSHTKAIDCASFWANVSLCKVWVDRDVNTTIVLSRGGWRGSSVPVQDQKVARNKVLRSRREGWQVKQ